MDSLFSNLINFGVVSFGLLMVYDFLTGLRELWLKSAPPRTSEKGVATNLETRGKGIKQINPPDEKQQTRTETEIEDRGTEPLAGTETCCCQSVIAIPEAALEVAEPPDFALTKLSSTQLRQMCSKRGIKWRNINGSKHLSKNEMILALTS